MTRMTGPDCVVRCNLINTYIHTHIHTYIQRVRGDTALFFLSSAAATVRLGLHAVFFICTFRANISLFTVLIVYISRRWGDMM